MLFALKVLLVIASYVLIFFTARHMWARILNLCTSISWILWMIIPHISSEIPKKSDLWQSIRDVAFFLSVYFVICYLAALLCFDAFNPNEFFHRLAAIGTIVFAVAAIVIVIVYQDIYDSNIRRTATTETNIVSSVKLAALTSNNELSGNLEGSIDGNYVVFSGSTQGSVNGTLTTEKIIEYWYYAFDGSINPGEVPRKSTKIIPIEDNETPHMDTVVRTKITNEDNYNTGIRTIYKQEVGRTYKFYIPKSSIPDSYNFNK